jgi:hypothetical protein
MHAFLSEFKKRKPVALGQHDRAKEWIENDSDPDPLRDHPRFQVILDSLPE